MSAYAELAVTTNFSFLRGASHGEELVERAKELGLAGLGVADRNSIAGVVRAHQKAKEAGLKFAPGTRLVFADGTPERDAGEHGKRRNTQASQPSASAVKGRRLPVVSQRCVDGR